MNKKLLVAVLTVLVVLECGSSLRSQDAAHPTSSDVSRSVKNKFGDRGELLEVTTETNGPDAMISTTVFEHDANGRMTSKTTTVERKSDGKKISREVTTFSYKEDSLSEEAMERDMDVDGTVDSRSSTQFGYQGGLLVSKTVTQDTNADGTIDSIDRHTFKYNSSKELVEEAIARDSDADGKVNSTVTSTFARDGNGKLTRKLIKSDNRDGTPDKRAVVTFTRPSGNTTKEDWQIDANGDGTFEQRRSMTNINETVHSHSVPRATGMRGGLVIVNLAVITLLLFIYIRRRRRVAPAD